MTRINDMKLQEWHIKVLDLLIDRKVIFNDEVQLITKSKIEELILRSSHDFKDLPPVIPEENIRK
jgi:hypothetical protein